MRGRLRAAEETLRAIRAGDVDAVVGAGGAVLTLAGVDVAYRLLFDRMSEGAVTLTDGGAIAYCNARFAALVRWPLRRVIGASLRRFVPPALRPELDALVAAGLRKRVGGETTLLARGSAAVPVALSFAPLRPAHDAAVIGAVGVITDLTARVQAEAERQALVTQAATTKEQERRRIARELHDETGQSLTALLVGLQAIEHSCPGHAAALARRLRSVAAQTLDEVGRLARGLHPAILEDLGLREAVSRYAHEFGKLHAVAVSVRLGRLDGDLPLAVQITLYRTLQEALTNVAKHAAAHRVDIRMAREGTSVALTVHDDGTGLGPRARRKGRLGLQVMRERAALLGGSVTIASRPGAGTTVMASYPIGARTRGTRRRAP